MNPKATLNKAWYFLIMINLVSRAPAIVAAEVATSPSGFITLNIAGHGGAGGVKFTFLGLGMARHTEFLGNLESFGPNTITDEGASWTDDQFNGANGAHFLEITSGTNAGVTTDIVDTVGGTKTLVLADDLSGLLAVGNTFKIRKHWTLAKLFGPNNEGGLGGGTVVTADQILTYDPLSKSYTIYYFQTSGLGGVGWRAGGSPTVNRAEDKFYLDQGIVISRKQASDVQVRLFGEVKLGPTVIPVEIGFNFTNNVYPADTLTLENSNLYTGNPSTGLNGGSVTSADQILIYNGTDYDIYYHQTVGLGGTGWRKAGAPLVDAANAILPMGKSFVIRRKFSAPFAWAVPQPF